MQFQKKVTIGIIVFFAIGTACLATNIHQAAKDGDLDKLKALLEKDPTLANARNESEETPLHMAAIHGHLDIVKFLIEKGSDVNASDNQRNTPLHLAANHGHKDVVELLLAKGGDVNNENKRGDTALHGAAWIGNREIAEILIAKGALVNIKNSEGNTPLDNALRGSHKEVIKLLKTKGANRMGDFQENPKKILSGKINQKGLSKPLKFTILYDNYLHQEGTKPDWGFSCLIEGAEKTILFDTGTQPDILLHNVDQLGVNLKKVEQIVISHDHHDHIGGLPAVLERNHEVSVYLPVSFAYEIVRSVETKKAEVVSVDEPVETCPNVYSTGEMGVQIKEQSLIINTDIGLVIVTGCSHQGIVEILRRAKELFDRPIHLVFGGFHLGGKPDAELEEIICHFKEIGVERCGATHCTGDRAIELFKKAYRQNYVPMGTGKILEINKLDGEYPFLSSVRIRTLSVKK